jgi:hypothetical protein
MQQQGKSKRSDASNGMDISNSGVTINSKDASHSRDGGNGGMIEYPVG